MLSIEPIHAFNDNYIWIISDQKNAWVVDPGDADAVEAHLENNHLNLEGVLITHHHPDHTGGLAKLTQNHPEITVYGPHNPSIKQLTSCLQEGEEITLLGRHFGIIETPGHTLDHICYFSEPANSNELPVLFSGDTLFAGGCGRLFEGTAGQMHLSLQKLAKLPTTTQVFCAHEYTLANLDFALAVEPDNKDLISRIQAAHKKRHQHLPTVPSTLKEELLSNPFLRINQQSVIAAAKNRRGNTSASETDTFAAIRNWKDQF